jgi:hypothetical protein
LIARSKTDQEGAGAVRSINVIIKGYHGHACRAFQRSYAYYTLPYQYS